MRRGFTLIEVVITLGVFSIASLMAVNLFVFYVQQQRRTVSQQELQSDARALIEEVADQLREGTLDYAYYQANFSAEREKLFSALDGTGNSCLVVVDPLNQQVRYRLQNGAVEKLTVVPADTTPCETATGWVNVTPADLTVDAFTIAVAPTENPFAARSPQSCTADIQCRWGTTCFNPGTTTCQFEKNSTCFCTPQKFSYAETDVGDAYFPLHPRVTFSLHVSRQAAQQTLQQTFQTTIASRVFKNADKLNRYAN